MTFGTHYKIISVCINVSVGHSEKVLGYTKYNVREVIHKHRILLCIKIHSYTLDCCTTIQNQFIQSTQTYTASHHYLMAKNVANNPPITQKTSTTHRKGN